MRKLTYDIFKNGAFVKNVVSYSEMMEYKEKGYQVKDKLIDLREKTVFDVYDGDKLINTVTLATDRAKARKEGYTIKTRIEFVEC